ncbi:MAG: DNA translocase FtsK, partial [Tannerella sp.]|nr:DNA translocase FtsK [Tannerella sp.]
IIKSNFPVRVAFRVSSMIDSRTILDSPGANRLIGRGDLLYSQNNEVTRVQCAFVDTPEVESIASFIGQQPGYPTAFMLPEYVPEGEERPSKDDDPAERDPLFEDVARMIVIQQQGSTSLIQRKFSVGHNRAGRLMDQLERAGIVGPADGSKPRQVLVLDEYTLEQKLRSMKQ